MTCTNDNNISVDKGKTKILDFTFSDENSLPINLTGSTIYLTVKKKYTDEDAGAILQKIITSHTDPTNGITRIEIVPADTADERIGNYFYDIQYSNALSQKFIVLRGEFYIKDVITRA